jgi:hypothetical protein
VSLPGDNQANRSLTASAGGPSSAMGRTMSLTLPWE